MQQRIKMIVVLVGMIMVTGACGSGIQNDIDSSLRGIYWFMLKDAVTGQLSAMDQSSQYKMEIGANKISIQGATFPLDRSVVRAKDGQIWSVSTDDSSIKVYLYDYQFDTDNTDLLLIVVDSSPIFTPPSEAAAEPWYYCREGADCSSGGSTDATDRFAPSDLTAKYLAENTIRLQWVDNSTDEQGFRIERKADRETAFTEVAVVPVGSILYDDSNVSANHHYAYRVIAVRAAGDTGPSNVAIISTWPASGPQWTLPDTGQTTCYDNSVSITCPSAGQAFYGQDAQYTTHTMNFTDNGNGTVIDNVTGLMWQQEDDNTERTWTDALSYCDGLTLGGHSDWRLPNEWELQSIIDYGSYSPSIDTTAFPNPNLSGDWSSSTYANVAYNAWVVSDGDGFVYSSSKTDYCYVGCVR